MFAITSCPHSALTQINKVIKSERIQRNQRSHMLFGTQINAIGLASTIAIFIGNATIVPDFENVADCVRLSIRRLHPCWSSHVIIGLVTLPEQLLEFRCFWLQQNGTDVRAPMLLDNAFPGAIDVAADINGAKEPAGMPDCVKTRCCSALQVFNAQRIEPTNASLFSQHINQIELLQG